MMEKNVVVLAQNQLFKMIKQVEANSVINDFLWLRNNLWKKSYIDMLAVFHCKNNIS